MTEFAIQPANGTVFTLPTDFKHGQIFRFHAGGNARYEIRSAHPICVFGHGSGGTKCHSMKPSDVGHLELEGVVVVDSNMKEIGRSWVSRRLSGAWETQ